MTMYPNELKLLSECYALCAAYEFDQIRKEYDKIKRAVDVTVIEFNYLHGENISVILVTAEEHAPIRLTLQNSGRFIDLLIYRKDCFTT